MIRTLPVDAPGPYPPSLPPGGPANLGDWIWSIVANVWEWIGDQQAVLVALATAVTAIIAIIALRSTANDSRERTRPIVLAFFRPAPHNDKAFDLVVRNYGISAASDILVTFDPPFSAKDREDRMVRGLAERYDKPVPLLPPGSEISNVWWGLDFQAPRGSGANRFATPDESEMTIAYSDSRGHRYKDKVKLDTNWMKGETSSVSSDSRPGLDKQNAESLKKIAEEARAARFFLRDIAEVMEEPEEESAPASSSSTLTDIISAHGSDTAALAAELGVSEEKAAAIAMLVDSQPQTGDIDVVSNGQITPGVAGSGGIF